MWPYPRIVAHRGGGTLAPENTIAAMRCGLDRGYRGVEFDVMLARDGIPVVMHDPELGRTVAGAGSIADFTAQELAVRDAGVWFGPEFEGEPVPTFAQVAAFCMQHGIWMNVEIKPVPGFEDRTGWVVAQTVQHLFAGLPDHRPAAMPLLSSFSLAALQAAQLAAPEVPRGLLIDDVPEDWHAQLRAISAMALHINHVKLTPVLARAVKEAGFGLFCYTVNDPVRARQLLAWGVDGFCTDRLDLIGPDFADRQR